MNIHKNARLTPIGRGRAERADAEAADEMKDDVTHDLLAGRIAAHEKAIRKLRSVMPR